MAERSAAIQLLILPKLQLQVDNWKRELHSSDGFVMFLQAENILLEFGGTRVGESGPGVTSAKEYFEIDPLLALGEGDRFSHFSDHVGTNLYPLGEGAGGHYFLAIGEDGRVFLLMEDIKIIGNDFDEALESLILGYRAKEV